MDRQKIERSIKGLSEWQMHVQAESDIDANISTAIEALKAQLFSEDTTSIQPVATDICVGDTISRQRAVDRFNVIRPVDPKKDEYTKGIDVGIAMCIVAVKDQPTIQPQSTTGQLNDDARSTAQSTDLIDRQAAIDAVHNSYDNILDFTSTGKTVADSIEDIISELPSAQPEPKEGHWIDKGWNGDWAWQIDGRGNCWRVIECSECGKSVSVESNYCPNCGADMRGGQNG